MFFCLFMSFPGYLPIYLACHLIAEGRRGHSHTSGAFHPSKRCRPRCSLYTASHPCPSLVGCPPFPHAIGSQ
uniref:Secreted protein n=1 Tax=Mesocestoides corti TaxID=53468 RepID=A0A5K3FIA0_MESCO